MLSKAYINLGAIKRNAKRVREKLPSTVKFCAVVKSDGYGHGLERVALSLYRICDCFAVSNIDEGVKLRRAGIDKQILVLVPCVANFTERAIDDRLTLAVQSVNDLELIGRLCAKTEQKCKVQIAFNSGMNRFGADLDELKKMLEFIAGQKDIILDGAFSHYAKPESKKQRETAKKRFLLANKLVKHYNNSATCHISASGGFLKGDYMDMVRIGILLYGYNPFDSDFKVEPAMKVFSPVISVRRLSRGEGCLYGLKKAKKKTGVSIVGYGYADGLPRRKCKRQFSNKCMDACAVKEIKKGYLAVMDNANLLAKEYGTISYEILTKSALRAEKIYYEI